MEPFCWSFWFQPKMLRITMTMKRWGESKHGHVTVAIKFLLLCRPSHKLNISWQSSWFSESPFTDYCLLSRGWYSLTLRVGVCLWATETLSPTPLFPRASAYERVDCVLNFVVLGSEWPRTSYFWPVLDSPAPSLIKLSRRNGSLNSICCPSLLSCR